MLKDYKYIESTISLCPICLTRVDGKIIERKSSIYIIKRCSEHGEFCDMLEEDAAYYHQRKLFDKPGNLFECQTPHSKGCPWDCGLCSQHEQHTCVGLIEVTGDCNLKCPVCFADSGDGGHLSVAKFEQMLDFFVASEGGQADILQISGGEPTLHPDIITIIEMARLKPVDYVMLNTNGIRIAQDEAFVQQLSLFKGRFEVYLQYDGADDADHLFFRGAALGKQKQAALDLLNRYSIPVTLVVTLQEGVNDHAIGKIIELGMSMRCVRGINFQPAGYFGRLPKMKSDKRMTITSVIRKIEAQTSSMIRRSDFIPLPCNSDRVAITYFFRDKKQAFIPLTRNLDVKKYLPFIKNTFKFDPSDFLKELTSDLFSKDCCSAAGFFKELTKLIPLGYMTMNEQEKLDYVSDNTFRISITSFVDAYNFDIKSVQKECVHVITPDLKKIPFSTYNLIHRKNGASKYK